MSEAVSRNAAKKKPRGKAFTGADDIRRNNAGQRSKEAVQTVAQARALYIQVLAEPPGHEVEPQTKLEKVVRDHVKAAMGEDGAAGFAREQLFDRLWGKSAPSLDHTSSDGSMTPPSAIQFVPYAGNDSNLVLVPISGTHPEPS